MSIEDILEIYTETYPNTVIKNKFRQMIVDFITHLPVDTVRDLMQEACSEYESPKDSFEYFRDSCVQRVVQENKSKVAHLYRSMAMDYYGPSTFEFTEEDLTFLASWNMTQPKQRRRKSSV